MSEQTYGIAYHVLKNFGKKINLSTLSYFHDYLDGILENNVLLSLYAIVNYRTRRLVTSSAALLIYFCEEEESEVEKYLKN